MMNALEFVKTCRRMVANDVQIKSVLGGWTAEDVVKQVDDYAKEHPCKTRQNEFLRMFPTADLDDNGILVICPAHVDARERHEESHGCGNVNKNCDACKREFWMGDIND